MSDLAAMWRPWELPDGQDRHWHLGACDLWVRRHGVEWMLAVRRGLDVAMSGPPAIDAAPPPADLPWLRLVAPGDMTALRVIPRLPDRPVISRPDHPWSLLPGAATTVYISIPAFLGVQLDPGGQLLYETPTTILSNSWSGSVMDGNLCYALRTTAKGNPAELLPAPHRLICPVRIRNRSADHLAIARVTLPVGELNVYLGETRLWTNIVEATYLGDEQWSRTRTVEGPPPHDRAQELVGIARSPAGTGTIMPLFSEFKNLAKL